MNFILVLKLVLLVNIYFFVELNPLHQMKKLVIFCAIISLFSSTSLFAQCEADHTVFLSNFEFAPSQLVVLPGESVGFYNLEGTHNVNGIVNSVTEEPFNNPTDFFLDQTIGSEEGVCMGTIVLETPGVYNFDCSLNFNALNGMNLSITVDAFDLNDQFLELQNNPDVSVFNSYYAFQSFTPTFLTSEGPWTLFVPNDAAVSEILEYMNLGQFDALGIPDFPEIMQFHIADGLYMAEDLTDGLVLNSVQGQTLNISENQGNVFVENAQIISTNYTAYNGVIHVIDQCLAPDSLPGAHVMQVIAESPNHQIFEDAIIAASLDDELSFQGTIDDSFDGPGPWTVFAPTDEAFQIFADEMDWTIDELLNSQFLYNIVNQHVVNGCVNNFNPPNEIDDDCNGGLSDAITSSIIYGGTVASNLEGDPIQFSTNDNDSTITVIGIQNAVDIIVSDLFAYNGVVHVVDAVLKPKIPTQEGSCGLWRLELQSSDPEGWQGSSVYLIVNSIVLETVTIFDGNSQTYEFALDSGDVVDLLYNANGGSSSDHSYKLYDADNSILVQTSGNSNNYGPSSFYGVDACPTPVANDSICGEITIKLFNDYGIGWLASSLEVFRNGALDISLLMPLGYGPQITTISSNYNDSFDFIVNSNTPYPEEIGYQVFDVSGALVVNENNFNVAPQSTTDLVFCESEEGGVGLSELEMKQGRLVKMIDVLGREHTRHVKGTILFYMYDNGRVEKRLNL